MSGVALLLSLCGKFGLQVHGVSGGGVGEFQDFGTKLLGGEAQLGGIFLGVPASVLGVPQNGAAHMGAVDPELVGPAGDGAQGKGTQWALPCKDLKFRPGGLALRGYIAQKTGQGPSGNRRINDPPVCLRAAKGQSVVSLLQLTPVVDRIQKRMDMGVFGKENDAEGIPVQPGDGMEGAFLTGPAVIAQDKVCKGPCKG